MPADSAFIGVTVGASGVTRSSHSSGEMVSQALSRINDSELIRAAQRGDRAAFETLVRQYDQAVLRLGCHAGADLSFGQVNGQLGGIALQLHAGSLAG